MGWYTMVYHGIPFPLSPRYHLMTSLVIEFIFENQERIFYLLCDQNQNYVVVSKNPPKNLQPMSVTHRWTFQEPQLGSSVTNRLRVTFTLFSRWYRTISRGGLGRTHCVHRVSSICRNASTLGHLVESCMCYCAFHSLHSWVSKRLWRCRMGAGNIIAGSC